MKIEVNGRVESCTAPAGSMALFMLRNELGLKGVRQGCGEGHCGACTVLVDGVPTTTCDLPVGALEGKRLRTPEGVGAPDRMHAVQAALLQEQAGQCGFCLGGILMTAVALVERPDPASEQDVRSALDRHLCRCGSHHRILRAVMKAVRQVHAA